MRVKEEQWVETLEKRAMRKESDGVRVDHEKKSDGVRVYDKRAMG